MHGGVICCVPKAILGHAKVSFFKIKCESIIVYNACDLAPSCLDEIAEHILCF